MFGRYKAQEQVNVLEQQADELAKKKATDSRYAANADRAAARAAHAKNQVEGVISHRTEEPTTTYKGCCKR